MLARTGKAFYPCVNMFNHLVTDQLCVLRCITVNVRYVHNLDIACFSRIMVDMCSAVTGGDNQL